MLQAGDFGSLRMLGGPSILRERMERRINGYMSCGQMKIIESW
jgi:hypothetical protein